VKQLSHKCRYINTRFWSDPWVVDELDPLQRYFFLYLITNEHTNIAGIYELSLTTMANETGLTKEQVREFLGIFESAGKVRRIDGWIMLRNFARHQRGWSDNVARGEQRIVHELPEEIRIALEAEEVGASARDDVEAPARGRLYPARSRPQPARGRSNNSDSDSDSDSNSLQRRRDPPADPAPSAAVAAKSEDRHVYHLIEQAFASQWTKGEFDYRREGRHIGSLEKKVMARSPPEEFAKAVLVTFWRLIHGTDKFWRGQPFLPSVLNSGGIWPRVLKELENMKAETLDSATQKLIGELWK